MCILVHVCLIYPLFSTYLFYAPPFSSAAYDDDEAITAVVLCRYTLVSNTMLRRNILRRGSAVDKYTSLGADGFRVLMYRYYSQHFTFDELDLPRELASRGVHDPETLPHYLYRDDALRAWRATASYCADMLRLFYAEDDDVITDKELQVNRTPPHSACK